MLNNRDDGRVPCQTVRRAAEEQRSGPLISLSLPNQGTELVLYIYDWILGWCYCQLTLIEMTKRSRRHETQPRVYEYLERRDDGGGPLLDSRLLRRRHHWQCWACCCRRHALTCRFVLRAASTRRAHLHALQRRTHARVFIRNDGGPLILAREELRSRCVLQQNKACHPCMLSFLYHQLYISIWRVYYIYE
jgi:hypothetical protein